MGEAGDQVRRRRRRVRSAESTGWVSEGVRDHNETNEGTHHGETKNEGDDRKDGKSEGSLQDAQLLADCFRRFGSSVACRLLGLSCITHGVCGSRNAEGFLPLRCHR